MNDPIEVQAEGNRPAFKSLRWAIGFMVLGSFGTLLSLVLIVFLVIGDGPSTTPNLLPSPTNNSLPDVTLELTESYVNREISRWLSQKSPSIIVNRVTVQFNGTNKVTIAEKGPGTSAIFEDTISVNNGKITLALDGNSQLNILGLGFEGKGLVTKINNFVADKLNDYIANFGSRSSSSNAVSRTFNLMGITLDNNVLVAHFTATF